LYAQLTIAGLPLTLI